MPVDERARKGLFLAMQYPAEVPGVTNAEFLRAAINARRPKDDPISVMTFLNDLDKNLDLLDMNEAMTERYLNEGFSGGEKKRNEILQMLMIKASFGILDEIDSAKSFDKNYRVQKFHEWQRWMYNKAYVVPTSGAYSVTAVNSKVTGWSLKPSANVWYEAGFSK